RVSYPWLFIVIFLVGITIVPVVGIEVQGNRNWLPLVAGFRLQPSELAKLALGVWAADLYARKEQLLKHPRHVWLPMLPVAAVVIGLIVARGDLGTALILFAIVLGMVWIAGTRRRGMRGIGATAAGYQSVHSMMAFATGRFFGVGLGASRQKWGTLPEAHTDFILSVIGEELGLFGTLVILVLFGFLTYAIIRIATRAREPFARHAAAGLGVWIMGQAMINIGMVLGLLPVIGVPLPLLSYGGSSLLVTLIAVGLLLNFAKTEPGAARALAAKK